MRATRRFFIFFSLLLFSWTSSVFASELSAVLGTIESQLVQATGDYKKLNTALKKIQNELYSLNPLETEKALQIEKLAQHLDTLFLIKKSLRTSLIELPTNYPSKDAISNNVKLVLSSIRYVEDYLFELLAESLPSKIDKKKILPFTIYDNFTQRESSFVSQISSLQTGDVILMRAVVFSSALIARVSDAPQTYSHMAMVYVDPATNKRFIIEGMLNSGFVKTELTPEFFKGQARVAVYRAQNSEIAKKAGEFGNFQFESAIQKGKPLEYDVSLGLEENCKYYCSKFVSWSYNSVLEKNMLPEYPSRLQFKNSDYASNLGMPRSSQYTYAPSDIDLDSTFELVYEFRNPNLTPAARLDDLIVDKMLYWIRKEKLDVVPGFFMDKTAEVIMNLAAKPYVQRVINRLNIHISPELDPKHLAILGASAILVIKFKKAIMPEYTAHLEKHGQPMAPRDIYKLIELKRRQLPALTKNLKVRDYKSMCIRFFAESLN